jgi:hypothetical protein
MGFSPSHGKFLDPPLTFNHMKGDGASLKNITKVLVYPKTAYDSSAHMYECASVTLYKATSFFAWFLQPPPSHSHKYVF